MDNDIIRVLLILPRHVRHSLDIHSRQKVSLLKMTELVRRFFRCHRLNEQPRYCLPLAAEHLQSSNRASRIIVDRFLS